MPRQWSSSRQGILLQYYPSGGGQFQLYVNGTRLDEETRKTLESGRRVREILKQPQYTPLPPADQLAGLIALDADDPVLPVPAAIGVVGFLVLLV